MSGVDATRWRESRHETAGGVRTITLDRPKQRNALTPDLFREIKEGILEGWADPQTRVVVLRGAPGAFASGGDLKHFMSLLDVSVEQHLWQFARSYEEPLPFRTMLECPKPIVSVVDGVCMAGGLIMAACSDVVIASERAVFAAPEGRVGLADPFCPVLLPRLIGDVRARSMLMSARPIDAATAGRWGLVTEVAEQAALEDTVAGWVRDLLAVAPTSAAAYKRAANAGIPHMSASLIAESAWSANGREGLQAFLDKRAPNWIQE